MALYDKPVKALFKDLVNELRVEKGDIINRDQFFSWFEEKYPKEIGVKA